MSQEKLSVAVVGLGKMGLLHVCILNVLPHVQVAALCEKSRLLRRFLQKVFHEVCVVGDVEELSGLGLDAVYVTTPISSHYDVIKSVNSMEVARNLFVEKTLAWSYEEAEELCEIARGLDGVNMVGYLRRFGVTFRKAKELLDEGALGRVSSANVYAYSSDFLGNELGLGPLSRGGVLRDLGCHAVDLALWYFGDLEVESVGGALPNSGDPVHFRAGNSDGLKVEFDASRRMDGYRMAEVGFLIKGSEGVMKVNDDEVELRSNGDDSNTWYKHDLSDNVPFWLGLPDYYREDLHFVESVLEGTGAEPQFHVACKVDKIIGQVLQGDDAIV